MKIDEIFESMSGVTAIVDGILVFGRMRKEHDTNLRNVFDRARNMEIRFNPDKKITDKGLQADNSKVEAIMKLDIPDTREKLERFLGMVPFQVC